MKKTDLAMIILIVSISVFAAYMTASAIFPNAYDPVKVKTIDLISSDLGDDLRTDIFNKKAINPTVKVQINETE
jgi:hypothetical protein